MQENSVTENTHFYTILKRLAIPIALQHMVATTVNLVDVLMLARLGTDAVAGAGLANQMYFLLIVLNYGLYSGMGVFLAQYWGHRDLASIHRTMGLGLVAGTVFALLFTAAGLFFPLKLLRLLSDDPAALALGAGYLKIVAFSYLATSFSSCLGIGLRSVGQPRLPLMTAVLSLTLNVSLNYLLIFGKCGFPALGVQGAAISTVIARLVELVLLIGLLGRFAPFILARPRAMLAFTPKFIAHYAKIAVPVAVNEGMWGLGMVMYVAAYEKLGTEALAVSQVTNTLFDVSQLVSMGIGNAGAVMLGNVIGEGKNGLALRYARRFVRLSLLLGAVTGGVLLAAIPLVLQLTVMPPAIKTQLLKSLIVLAALSPVKTLSVVLIVGIMRGGGDTRFAMLLEVLTVWLIGVPLAFFGAITLRLPVYWLLLLVSSEEFVKVLLGLHRTRSGKWVRDVTLQ